jgi:SAM-dependent methyltransferase
MQITQLREVKMFGRILNNAKVQLLNHNLSKWGLDPIRFVTSIKPTAIFYRDYQSYKKLSRHIEIDQGPISWSPQLGDLNDGAGISYGHYFWQDLIVARKIFEQNPLRHVDIGSRIDGFIAHLLVFRKVEIIDIRKFESFDKNLDYSSGDAMDLSNFPDGSIESISSLHAIEHFGLGRYGDPLNPNGHIQAIKEIQRVLKQGGYFYLSFPAGLPRVLFNDRRIVDISLPTQIMNECDLVEFIAIPGVGKPHYHALPEDFRNDEGYCGLWVFKKR